MSLAFACVPVKLNESVNITGLPLRTNSRMSCTSSTTMAEDLPGVIVRLCLSALSFRHSQPDLFSGLESCTMCPHTEGAKISATSPFGRGGFTAISPGQRPVLRKLGPLNLNIFSVPSDGEGSAFTVLLQPRNRQPFTTPWHTKATNAFGSTPSLSKTTSPRRFQVYIARGWRGGSISEEHQ